MSVVASAPGKLILAGEHAAVYGHPALVAALGLRARVEMTADPARGDGPDAPVEIELADAETRQSTSWGSLAAEATRAREHWRTEMERPGSFRPLSRDAGSLVRLALGEALAARPGHTSPPAARLVLRSELPLGAGCGSSAAVASAVAAATLFVLERRRIPDPDAISTNEIERVVVEVERRQHGNPSGVDAATVLRGGLLWCRRGGGALSVERVGTSSRPLRDLGAFALLHTGTPGESTGEVVAHVRARRDEEPERIESALGRIGAAAELLRSAIQERSPVRVLAALRDCARGLEDLGVVPEPLRELRRRVEEAGGAAKVSGAGAVSGHAAGVMLVYHPARDAFEELKRSLDVAGARWLPEVELGARGLEWGV